ncbi:MAG: hypothetical protein KatS3mg115_1744 [Candidatus Poribacteria bacterium]|nr:MAG: hypothetical protein KatS3mg115_1744 [Candidatus Poribacteria bacterium]
MADLLEKLQDVEARFREVEEALSDPKVYENPAEAQRLGKLRAELLPIVEATVTYRKILEDLRSAQELLEADEEPEIAALAKEELDHLEEEKERLERRLKVLLLPKDPNDEKNTVVEIRAGTGGGGGGPLCGRPVPHVQPICRKPRLEGGDR